MQTAAEHIGQLKKIGEESENTENKNVYIQLNTYYLINVQFESFNGN